MEKFKEKPQLIPKHNKGSGEEGIQLQYNSPQYYQVREQMKKEHPEAYNALQVAVAKSQNPHSEVVMYTDANGTQRSASNTGAGFVSGTDPVGAEVVAGAVLGKPLELAGRAAMYGLGRAGNKWAKAKLISRKMNDVVDEGQQYFGKVKYYGPTMGKTTATKTNPDLVDFDDFTREAKNNLAKELNISTRVLQSDPKYAQAYQEMLEKQLDNWRRNPLNTDKTLVISKKGLADKNVYNNEPSIPDRQTFVQRQRNRGETDDANSNDWYNMLMKQNPNLRIDNRFVSEIEYNPHYIGFQMPKQQVGGKLIKRKNNEL